MHITTEARALYHNHPPLRNKALLLDINFVNPCASSNLGNAARHAGKHLADAVERKKNKYRGSFPATYSFLRLSLSTCGDVGPDGHTLIKELAIRRIENRSETHSIESQNLAKGTRVAHLQRRFSFCFTAGTFIPHASLSLQTGVGACEHPTAPFARPGVCTRASYRAGNESKGREGVNGVGVELGVGGGNGDRNKVGGENGYVNGHRDWDGARVLAEMGKGVEAYEGAKDGNGDGSRDGAGTGTGTGVETWARRQDGNGDGSGDGNESSSGDGNGDEDGRGKERGRDRQGRRRGEEAQETAKQL